MPVRELLLASDAVLAIGTEIGETDYDLVFDGNLRIGGTLVRIDIDPGQMHGNRPADVAIVGDRGLAIDALLARLDGSGPHAWQGRRKRPAKRSTRLPSTTGRPGALPRPPDAQRAAAAVPGRSAGRTAWRAQGRMSG